MNEGTVALYGLLGKMILALAVLFLIKFIFEEVAPELYRRFILRLKFKKQEKWRHGRDLLYSLRKMSPTDFEEYIADLFRRQGYSARAVGRSHDGGIDVEATKDGVTHLIQCKKFITSQVGVHDVRDFYGAITDRLSDGKGYFITTNIFTHEAEKFAEDKRIELIDGTKLLALIKEVNGEDVVPDIASDEQKICPNCNIPLVKRSGKRGQFLGCKNYPKCRHTENI